MLSMFKSDLSFYFSSIIIITGSYHKLLVSSVQVSNGTPLL